MCQDWSADIRKRCSAASHLPPAGLHGGAHKMWRSFSPALPPPLSLLSQLGEPKRHRGPFLWAMAHRRCVIGEKPQSSWSLFLLLCSFITSFLCSPSAHLHGCTHTQDRTCIKVMSCVSVREPPWLTVWLMYSCLSGLLALMATNRKAVSCKNLSLYCSVKTGRANGKTWVWRLSVMFAPPLMTRLHDIYIEQAAVMVAMCREALNDQTEEFTDRICSFIKFNVHFLIKHAYWCSFGVSTGKTKL